MLDNSNSKINNIIFFDGYCNLCNHTVDFILLRDKLKIFSFGSLQSNIALKLLSKYGYPLDKIKNLDNVVYLRNGKLKIKSEAVLSILFDLRGIYRISYIFYLFPKFLRDFLYDYIARKRYKWFGKRNICRIPTPEELSRFVE